LKRLTIIALYILYTFIVFAAYQDIPTTTIFHSLFSFTSYGMSWRRALAGIHHHQKVMLEISEPHLAPSLDAA
jgi:hypothetical protein